MVWLYVYGVWPSRFIDHIDHNPSNNRIVNLRDVSASDNMRNRRLGRHNTSGAHGVRFDKLSGRWTASININLGSFDRRQDAVDARKSAEVKFGYHPLHGVAA